MATYVIRVWLPDRPGALGAVASRIGAVRADVIGIDIIERGAGRAVDDLVIDLPDPQLVDLLLAEIGEVEGVDVEHLRPLEGPPSDPAVLALRCAAALRAAPEDEVPTRAVESARSLLGARWAALVDAGAGAVLASVGQDVPEAGWLCAFVLGATAEGSPVDLADVAVATVPGSSTALVVGRPESPLRGREQDVLEALAAML